MNEAFLLIGGNMGDRGAYLSKARDAVRKRCGRIVKESSLYETAAWGRQDQDHFLNQVLHVQTPLTADELLRNVLKAEEDLGRTRDRKYGPRTIDIDILLFNEDVVNRPGLTIPHPEMQNRRFVLVPLNEIAPGKLHPVLNQTIAEVLADCTDPLAVYKFT